MSTPGFWEIAALAVIALLIFGPDKLPGMAHSVGKTLAQFKREATSTLDELKAAAELEDMRGVADEFADEFKGVSNELKQSASLAGTGTGAAAAAATRARGAAASAAPSGPPPFDPDAT